MATQLSFDIQPSKYRSSGLMALFWLLLGAFQLAVAYSDRARLFWGLVAAVSGMELILRAFVGWEDRTIDAILLKFTVVALTVWAFAAVFRLWGDDAWKIPLSIGLSIVWFAVVFGRIPRPRVEIWPDSLQYRIGPLAHRVKFRDILEIRRVARRRPFWRLSDATVMLKLRKRRLFGDEIEYAIEASQADALIAEMQRRLTLLT